MPTLDPWLWFALALAIALVAAGFVALAVSLVVRVALRRRPWTGMLVHHLRHPFRTLVVLAALWIGFSASFPGSVDWRDAVVQLFAIAAIAVAAWLMIALVRFTTDVTIGHYRIDVPDNRIARRIRSQTLIVRRVVIALIVVLAFGAILLTFPSVRAFGASVLASAGIASIVAGLAAQSVLANMFAGIQLVFSDALRVDDVIVAEGEWGRVGEITLSYVVLDLWDDRRLVLPCTYFTTTPFQNWTREGSELLGAVELDVDWRVPTGRMREHLEEYLSTNALWDDRASVLQVTDAVGGLVRVRILVTAKDAPTLFDLRCQVREEMVRWVQQTAPAALPVQRVLVGEPAGAGAPEERHEPATDTGGLFTGSAAAEERAAQYTQAIPVVSEDDPDR
jgi:small-conductance mechanosensitive channel